MEMPRPKVKKPLTLPNGAPVNPLIALDDPGDVPMQVPIAFVEGASEAPPAARGSAHRTYAPESEERMTVPPAPTYEMLRDSCKIAVVAAEFNLDEPALDLDAPDDAASPRLP